jgi:MinD-like ATPase involved in chromosome partitioning or flagellar assembly
MAAHKEEPMSKIVSIHSFRGGTGKSNVTANVTTMLAQRGLRVGAVDTDIQSPGIHVIFGLEEQTMHHSLNDFLWGECSIEEAAHDVGEGVGLGPGQIYLIPSSIKTGEILRVLKEGYEVQMLYDGFFELVRALDLDILLIDTHPGLNEETLTSIAFSDGLIILMRPDQQDYLGTAVTVEVARGLGVPHLYMVVNKCPASFDVADVKARVESSYNSPVLAVLPLAEEVVRLASSGVFCLQYPNHPFSRGIGQIVEQIQAL